MSFLFLTSGTAWWSATRNTESAHWVQHTYDVLLSVKTLEAAMFEASSLANLPDRSRNPAAPRRFEAATAAVRQSFASLRQLTQDHADQQREMDAAEKEIEQVLGLLTQMAEVSRQSAPDRLAALRSQELPALTTLNTLLSKIRTAETNLLQRRVARANALTQWTLAATAVGGVGAITIVALVGFLMKKEVRQRLAIQAEQDRFFALSPALLAVVRPDGSFARVSPVVTALLGWDVQKFLSRPYLEFVHPEDRATVQQALEPAPSRARKPPLPPTESRWRHQDGSWRWLSWTWDLTPEGWRYGVAWDVTATRATEQALRRSEEKLAITLRSIGDAVLATDADSRVTRLNPVAEQLTGWTEAEARGRPAAEVFHILNEETRQPAEDPIRRVLATGVIHGLANHTLLVSRDGAEYSIADSAAPIRGAGDEILGVVIVFRNVSAERAQASETAALLKKLQDFQRSMDEHLIVAITDSQGRITHVNDKFCAISRYSREELLGQNHRIINSGHHPKSFFRGLWATISQGKIWRGEIRNRAKDGSFYWVETTIVPFLDAAGKPVQYIALRTDVTATKQAFEELARLNTELEQRVAERTREIRAREERLSRLIASHPGAVYAGEVEAPWPASFMSAAAGTITGHPAEDFLAGRVHRGDLVHAEDLPRVKEEVRRCVKARAPYEIEYRLRRRDGSLRWVEEVGRAVYADDGTPARLEGNIFDVTRRKLAEQREQSRSRALERLAADAPLEEVLEIVAREIEAEDPETLCSILLLDAAGKRLRHGTAPSLPEFYTEAIDGVEIGETVGSCGAAAFTGRRVVAEDLRKDPRWEAFRELTERAGLRACWSEPVFSTEGRVLGTFAFYHRQPGPPTPGEIERLEWGAPLVAMAIEHSLAREQAAESARFTRATLDALSTRLAVLDAEGCIVATNQAWQAWKARPDGDASPAAAKTNYLDLCDRRAAAGDVEAARLAEALRDILGGRRAMWTHEISPTSAAGGEFLRCGCKRFPGEGPVRVVVTFEDVSEARRTEQELTASQHQFAELFDFAPEGIVLTDEEAHILDVNRVAERIFGWNRAEVTGQSIEVLMPAAPAVDAGELRRKFLATARNQPGNIQRSDLEARRKDGSLFPASVTLCPLPRTQSKVVVAAFVEDLTKRRNAEREMRRAYATLDTLDDAAFLVDPDTFAFLYVNEGAIRQLGYSRQELLTMTVPDVSLEAAETRLRELVAPVLRGERHRQRFTSNHRHRDGHQIAVEIHLQLLKLQGERPCLIALARDIRERVEQEKMALRSQRLEAIGNLAGGVAHDLNNALAPILMSLELLRLEHPQETETLETLEASAQRAASMVRQLLTFAKGTAGERKPLQPHRLLGELEQIMKSTFPKNVRLKIHCPRDLPPVQGDATQLHQVLLNLCVNARDAMPQGGALTLEAETAEVDAAFASSIPHAHPGHYVVIRVHDTGTGMPPEVLDQIFEPFFTTKGPDKGTGLGLATLLGIVKTHGGFVQVHSQVGKGSTFVVYLPVAPDAGVGVGPVEEPPVSSTPFRGHGEVILFVDDESRVREVARVVLSRLGFTPVLASDGAEGLLQLLEHRKVLPAVITDLHMPHMGGVAFVRALRRVLPDLPVVIASGRLDPADAEALKELGVTVRLDKPFTEQQLAAALELALGAGGPTTAATAAGSGAGI